jgi:hypothetical protein
VDGSLVYDSGYVKKPLTFRQLIRPNYGTVPWLNFGIDLVFGTVTDQKATITGYMFLPEHMMNIYNKTFIVKGDSVRPLIYQSRELFPSRLTFVTPSALTSPSSVFDLIFVFIVSITVIGQVKRRHYRWIDFSLYLIFGILGSLMLFLMTASLHEELWYNYNIVWADPVILLIALGTIARTKALWYKYILLVYSISLTIFVPVSFIIPQEISAAVYPIVGILWLRSIVLLKNGFYSDKKWLFFGVTNRVE